MFPVAQALRTSLVGLHLVRADPQRGGPVTRAKGIEESSCTIRCRFMVLRGSKSPYNNYRQEKKNDTHEATPPPPTCIKRYSGDDTHGQMKGTSQEVAAPPAREQRWALTTSRIIDWLDARGSVIGIRRSIVVRIGITLEQCYPYAIKGEWRIGSHNRQEHLCNCSDGQDSEPGDLDKTLVDTDVAKKKEDAKEI